jgi:hypothetical protein
LSSIGQLCGGKADYYLELAASGPHRQETGAECCGSRGIKLKVTTTVFVIFIYAARPGYRE